MAEQQAAVKEEADLGLGSFLSTSAPTTDAPKEGAENSGKPSPEAPAQPEVKGEQKEVVDEKQVKAVGEAKPTEVKEKAETPKPEEAKKPSFDWEADDNPYKVKLDQTEKRLKDTRDWSTSVNQSNVELKRSLDIIQKKLDGTYDPEKDAPSQPSVHDVARNSEISGRIKASQKLAVEKYGEDYVNRLIWDKDAPLRQFDNDISVQSRILSADVPVLEAIRFLEERDFYAKWGGDPKTIESNIRKKAEEELTQKITDEVTKQFEAKISLKDKQVNGIGGARSSEAKKSDQQVGSEPLSSIFASFK